VRRRGPVAVVLLTAALLLTGCTETSGSTVNVGAGGTVTEWKNPTSPVGFRGATVSGGTFDSKRYLGKVVVANFWYAGCGPCRGEAKDLNAVAASESPADVQFVGINISDERSTAQGFTSTFDVKYPSILDQAGGGSVQLAFAQNKPTGAVPTTLVLDRKGRVVSRVIGAIDPDILKTLIQDAVDGKAA
jgi:thiol-disulfide isomerase/thioredoxin